MRSLALAALTVVSLAAGMARADEPAAHPEGLPAFPAPDPSRSPDEQFSFTALGIIRVGDDEWRPYRGKYRERVSQEEFLTSVGRGDLAAKIRSQRLTANLLGYGGGAAALTGVAFLMADWLPGGFDPPVALGLGLGVGGLACWIASSFIVGPVATQAEVEEWADRYNQRLGDHLKRQPPEEKTRGTLTWWRALRVAPWNDARGGFGLSAGGPF